MIRLSVTGEFDFPQIRQWCTEDPYHANNNFPEWWATGNGLLAFRLDDEVGPLTYFRFDDEGEYVRVHIQFAPEEVVSKRRLVVGLLQTLDVMKVRFPHKRGFVFESVSPSLIAFFGKNGFKPVGGNDYRFDFEVTQ